jgi:hypothetical protein
MKASLKRKNPVKRRQMKEWSADIPSYGLLPGGSAPQTPRGSLRSGLRLPANFVWHSWRGPSPPQTPQARFVRPNPFFLEEGRMKARALNEKKHSQTKANESMESRYSIVWPSSRGASPQNSPWLAPLGPSFARELRMAFLPGASPPEPQGLASFGPRTKLMPGCWPSRKNASPCDPP